MASIPRAIRHPGVHVRGKNFLKRLEVNIRCAFLDCIEQNLVNEPYDGCVIDISGTGNIVLLQILVGLPTSRLSRSKSSSSKSAMLVSRDSSTVADFLLKLVLFNDDRFDTQSGLETDFVERMQICRIGDGDERCACRVSPAATRDVWQAGPD